MNIIDIGNISTFKNVIKKFKNKILIVYFYCEDYQEINQKIESYIKEQCNNNIVFSRINAIKSKDLIDKLDITSYPLIRIYNHQGSTKDVYISIENYSDMLDIIYKC